MTINHIFFHGILVFFLLIFFLVFFFTFFSTFFFFFFTFKHTVVNNIALSVGGSFSAGLADAFGITLENYENLFILTLITSLSTLLPILLIPMVPEGVQDCEESADAVDETTGEARGEMENSVVSELRRERRASSTDVTPKIIEKSKYGGGGFLFVLIAGLLYSIVNAGVKLSARDVEIVESPTGNITTIDGMNAMNSTFQWNCTVEAALESEEREENEESGKHGDV